MPTDRQLRRKLHAAELIHLREVVAEQQAQIEALHAQLADMERQANWAHDRADMFADLARDLQDAQPHLQVGLTRDGRAGVLQ